MERKILKIIVTYPYDIYFRLFRSFFNNCGKYKRTRLKVNINEVLVKHHQKDDVAEEKPEKQLLQEDKENVSDK